MQIMEGRRHQNPTTKSQRSCARSRSERRAQSGTDGEAGGVQQTWRNGRGGRTALERIAFLLFRPAFCSCHMPELGAVLGTPRDGRPGADLTHTHRRPPPTPPQQEAPSLNQSCLPPLCSFAVPIDSVALLFPLGDPFVRGRSFCASVSPSAALALSRLVGRHCQCLLFRFLFRQRCQQRRASCPNGVSATVPYCPVHRSLARSLAHSHLPLFLHLRSHSSSLPPIKGVMQRDRALSANQKVRCTRPGIGICILGSSCNQTNARRSVSLAISTANLGLVGRPPVVTPRVVTVSRCIAPYLCTP